MATWLSIPNGGLGEMGLNNLGGNFKARNKMYSLVRESVQNSLDAKRDDADRVTMDFSCYTINPYDIPDVTRLRQIFSRCKEGVENPIEKEFFEKGMNETLYANGRNKTLGILKIGDHGTTGLTGIETYAPSGRFRGLVTSMGKGNSNAWRLGGFGVGKQALFLASDIRTVFFSTIDSETGFAGHMGVAILSSFRDPTLGNTPDGLPLCANNTVYCCNESYDPIRQCGNPAIPGQFMLASRDDKDFGTDVFIVGFDTRDKVKLTHGILTVLLKEFIVAIDEERLEVVLPDGFTLRKDTLHDALERFEQGNPGKKDSRKIKGCYSLLDQPWIDSPRAHLDWQMPSFPAGAIQCKFAKAEEDSVCYVARERGMFVHTFKNICGSSNCIGIAVIRDKELNAAFKAMENERHDCFEVTDQRFPDARKLEVAKAQLQKLEEIIREIAEREIGAKIEERTGAVLPDELEELMDICAGQVNITSVKGKKGSVKIAAARVKRHKHKPRTVVQAEPANVTDNDDNDESGVQQTNQKTNKRKRTNPGGRKHVNPDSPEANGYAMRSLEVSPVVYAIDGASSGRYKVRFTVPRSKKKVCLCFSATTESDSQERLAVLSATAANPDGEMVQCAVDLNGTAVSFENVKSGQVISAEVTFDISYYCYSQVRYYEKKNN